MREILFRGKTHGDEWVYGNLFQTSEWANILIVIDDSEPKQVKYNQWAVIPESVGQFTGLTDKNGNKIFEGDILKWNEKEWGEPFNEIARWDYSLFDMRKNDWKEWCEIIGNIHDNADLATRKGEHND